MDLIEFILKAKTNAYAGGGEGGETRLADGSLEMTYQADEFRYRDRYFGWNPFAGEEVVWRDGEIAWLMNYFGEVTSPAVSARDVYEFLQEAMRLVGLECPYRGPETYRRGDWEYCDASQGTPEAFTGQERIFWHGQEVYRLHYHGGRVIARTD